MKSSDWTANEPEENVRKYMADLLREVCDTRRHDYRLIPWRIVDEACKALSVFGPVDHATTPHEIEDKVHPMEMMILRRLGPCYGALADEQVPWHFRKSLISLIEKGYVERINGLSVRTANGDKLIDTVKTELTEQAKSGTTPHVSDNALDNFSEFRAALDAVTEVRRVNRIREQELAVEKARELLQTNGYTVISAGEVTAQKALADGVRKLFDFSNEFPDDDMLGFLSVVQMAYAGKRR